MPRQAPVRVKAKLVQRQSLASPQLQDSEQEIVPESPTLSRIAIQQAKYTPRDLSRNDVLNLQRHLGNRSVRRLLARPAAPSKQPAKAAPHSPHIMRQSVWGTAKPPAGGTGVVQRLFNNIPGKSSGWFRKGRRDQVKAMVDAYLDLEKATIAKKTVEKYQMLLAELEKIFQAARSWKLDVISKPAKAAEIQTWIDTELLAEIALKENNMAQVKQAAALEEAWAGAKYNALYATPAYTTSTSAGANWLAAPDIAGIFKYYIVKHQYEGNTLNAYEEIMAYKKATSAEKALAIYHKYKMDGVTVLNITGEGVEGNIGAINATRRVIEALEGDPSNPPANFGAIEEQLTYVINELMVSFRTTPQYKKVTTAPAVPAAVS